MGIDPVTHKPKSDALSSSSDHFKDTATLSHMTQWESARLEAEARLVRESMLVSNSIQKQLNTPTSAQLINKNPSRPALPPCLDVLKAWQGVWSKSMSAGLFPIAGDGLEFPTSTLNFSENALPIQTVAINESTVTAVLDFAKSSITCNGGFIKEVCQMPEYKKRSDIDTMALQEMMYTTESAWLVDSFRAGNENTPLSNIMEGFTDTLAYNCDDQNSLMAGDNLNNGNKSCSDDFEDDNNNYWNSMLNLVHTWTSSGSPMF
jgi:myb proto-oncogene protein